MADIPAPTSEPISCSALLKALREARGSTQDGWAASLGVSRATVQRWESGDAAPTLDGEAALVRLCAEKALLRAYASGPLRGVTVTAALLRQVFADARLAVSGRPPSASMTGAPVPAEAAPIAAAAARRGTLPAPLTSFIGRQADLAAAHELLGRPGCRLVTLVGAGGIGKTRLALQIAADRDCAGGVWLVELASLADPALLPQAVALALGVREGSEGKLNEALAEQLGAAPALLVLDNCEHLIGACAALAAALLRACPALQILATSREPLRIPGETTWRVPSLSLPASPDGDHDGLLAALAQSEAAQLFVERARAAATGFALTADNARALAEICTRLDGIPLALELAAARANVLSAAQIAARLDDRFRLLAGGPRTVLPRQQTLRAALDWSHALLAEPERALLRRLAVFASGCGIEAAEAICADERLPAADILDLLSQLVDKSLVIAHERRGEVRYGLLETVRQYARERLEAAAEATALRRRHLTWFAALAARAEPELRGASQATWLDRLELEIEDLCAAIEWSFSTEGDPEAGGAIVLALRSFWFTRGRAQEGRLWLERTLQRDDLPARRRAQCLDGVAMLAHSQSDHTVARRCLEESLSIWRTLEDERGLAVALGLLGLVLKSTGDLVAAAAALGESLALRRRLADRGGVAATLNNLAAIASDRGDFQQARTFGEESLAMKRTLGDTGGISNSLHNLGELALNLRDYDRAAELFAEELALARELNHGHRVAHALHSLGLVRARQGRPAEASALFAESLTAFAALGERWGMMLCLEGAAEVAALRADWAQAALLLSAADTQRAALGTPRPPAERAGAEATLAAANLALSETACAAAVAQGRALSLETAGALVAAAAVATAAAP